MYMLLADNSGSLDAPGVAEDLHGPGVVDLLPVVEDVEHGEDESYWGETQ